MNGNSIFLDTNIILYLISGDQSLAELLSNKTIYISFISELELLGFKDLDSDEKQRIEELLESITIIDINAEIKKLTTSLRKNYKIKLPDAIIVATSYFLNLPLMTSDKQISKISEVNILQYEK
ncbi:hypothetical protein BH23BAC1_BH23BAC1_21520 [soil metagenome]